jgi:hypothetical protein
VEKVKRYRLTIGTILTEGPRRTSRRSISFISLSAEGTSVSKRSSCTDGVFAKGYINTLRMGCFYKTFCGQEKYVLRTRVCSTYTTVPCRQGVILMLSANVSIALQPQRLGTLSWSSICCVTGWLPNGIVISWELFYWGCLKLCLCDADVVVSAQWGRCPAVVERDISRKVAWMSRAECMASSVAGSNSDGFSSVGTPDGARLYNPPPSPPDYPRSRGKVLSSCHSGRCELVKACLRACREAHCSLPWTGRKLLRTPFVTTRRPWSDHFDSLRHEPKCSTGYAAS